MKESCGNSTRTYRAYMDIKLIPILNRLNTATTFFRELEKVNPIELAGARTQIASIILELSLMYPQAKKDMLAIKAKRHRAYLEFRGSGGNQKDSEIKAEILFEEERANAEYVHDQIRFAIDGATEIANALATEIKTLELQTKNLL